MWALAIGILCSLAGVKLPPVATKSLNLLGKATPGVSLFCLGLIMSSVQLKLSSEVWANLTLKLEAATSILASTVLSLVTFSFAIYFIDNGLAAA